MGPPEPVPPIIVVVWTGVSAPAVFIITAPRPTATSRDDRASPHRPPPSRGPAPSPPLDPSISLLCSIEFSLATSRPGPGDSPPPTRRRGAATRPCYPCPLSENAHECRRHAAPMPPPRRADASRPARRPPPRRGRHHARGHVPLRPAPSCRHEVACPVSRAISATRSLDIAIVSYRAFTRGASSATPIRPPVHAGLSPGPGRSPTRRRGAATRPCYPCPLSENALECRRHAAPMPPPHQRHANAIPALRAGPTVPPSPTSGDLRSVV